MFFVKILDFLFARIFFYKLNILFLKLILRFLGFNHHGNLRESGEILFLNKICKENPLVCIDVGAYIGDYSKYILNNSNSNVYAFEPILKSYKKLKKYEKIYSKRFFVFNEAISNKIGKKKIYLDKNNLHWSSLDTEIKSINYLKDVKNFETCKINTLDNFFSKNKNLLNKKITLIKIDTEGHEYEVLLGAKNLIRKLQPKYIQIEYNWHHLFKNVNLYTFSKVLKNYEVFKILPYDKKLLKIDPKRPENNYFNYSNIVFKKK